MKNHVYISGPHGGGKTTFVKYLASSFSDAIEEGLDVDFVQLFPSLRQLKPFERGLFRMYHRFYLFEHYKRQRYQKDTCIIVNRSLYDSVAYNECFRTLGMINHKEYSFILDTIRDIIGNLKYAPFTIVLNPPVSTIMHRLNRRKGNAARTSNRRLSKGDTEEFISTLHSAFVCLKTYPNVLYVEDNSEAELNQAWEWINA